VQDIVTQQTVSIPFVFEPELTVFERTNVKIDTKGVSVLDMIILMIAVFSVVYLAYSLLMVRQKKEKVDDAYDDYSYNRRDRNERSYFK
jgi:hypothetical protein